MDRLSHLNFMKLKSLYVFELDKHRAVASMRRTEALASVKILSLFFRIFVLFF